MSAADRMTAVARPRARRGRTVRPQGPTLPAGTSSSLIKDRSSLRWTSSRTISAAQATQLGNDNELADGVAASTWWWAALVSSRDYLYSILRRKSGRAWASAKASRGLVVRRVPVDTRVPESVAVNSAIEITDKRQLSLSMPAPEMSGARSTPRGAGPPYTQNGSSR